MGRIHLLLFLVLIIGGLNWLTLGATGSWDVVGKLFGGQNTLPARAIYILVGTAAIFELTTHRWRCKDCAALRRIEGSRYGGMQPNGTAY